MNTTVLEVVFRRVVCWGRLGYLYFPDIHTLKLFTSLSTLCSIIRAFFYSSVIPSPAAGDSRSWVYIRAKFPPISWSVTPTESWMSCASCLHLTKCSLLAFRGNYMSGGEDVRGEYGLLSWLPQTVLQNSHLYSFTDVVCFLAGYGVLRVLQFTESRLSSNVSEG